MVILAFAMSASSYPDRVPCSADVLPCETMLKFDQDQTFSAAVSGGVD
jgi:hypothetical protein